MQPRDPNNKNQNTDWFDTSWEPAATWSVWWLIYTLIILTVLLAGFAYWLLTETEMGFEPLNSILASFITDEPGTDSSTPLFFRAVEMFLELYKFFR